LLPEFSFHVWTFEGIAGLLIRARRYSMKNGTFHSGINMSKISVGAGFAGLVFTIGSIAIFLIGLPMLWYFLAGAIALGIGFAAILRVRHH
jgi:hypothetical protein